MVSQSVEQVNTVLAAGKEGRTGKQGMLGPPAASSCPRGGFPAGTALLPLRCRLRFVSGPGGSAQFVSGSAQASFTSFVSHLSCRSWLPVVLHTASYF